MLVRMVVGLLVVFVLDFVVVLLVLEGVLKALILLYLGEHVVLVVPLNLLVLFLCLPV